MAQRTCPVCGDTLVPFAELPDEMQSTFEADPDRQAQSLPHRREKHTACPGCGLELHGCGQPYAIPAEASSSR